jgi:hypothetical protein
MNLFIDKVHGSMIILTLVINKYAHSKWMKLHNEELENLYLSPNFVREIKSLG